MCDFMCAERLLTLVNTLREGSERRAGERGREREKVNYNNQTGFIYHLACHICYKGSSHHDQQDWNCKPFLIAPEWILRVLARPLGWECVVPGYGQGYEAVGGPSPLSWQPLADG